MPLLELQNLTHRFGTLTALDNLSLQVEQGEFISLLGPSGCGKTTTIRLVAGFLTPTAGRILLNGRDISSVPPEKRHMGMVFQSYALFPHLNVFENVAFGLKARGVPASRLQDKVKMALELVNLPGYETRPVFQLSGGEQQRTAIARAIVIEPQILLLDEPLSNLDASLREATRKQLRSLTKSLGITALFVTHDQEEAFVLSDRIALLSQGVCHQVGTPQELYFRPCNEWVARFIGKSNILSLPCLRVGPDWIVFSLPSGDELKVPRNGKEALVENKEYQLLLRPEAIELEPREANVLMGSGRIVNRQFSGSFSEYEVEIAGMRLTITPLNAHCRRDYSLGEQAPVYYVPDALHVFS